MTLLASEFFNLREKRVTKEAEFLSVLKESASLLPLGFTQPWPVPYKPSTKSEKAGALPDTEMNQTHGASLSSPRQCHSSQLVFAGSCFLIITFLFSRGPWPPSSPSPPHLQQQEHGSARQAGQLSHSDPEKRNLPLSSPSC